MLEMAMFMLIIIDRLIYGNIIAENFSNPFS